MKKLALDLAFLVLSTGISLQPTARSLCEIAMDPEVLTAMAHLGKSLRALRPLRSLRLAAQRAWEGSQSMISTSSLSFRDGFAANSESMGSLFQFDIEKPQKQGAQIGQCSLSQRPPPEQAASN